MEELILLQKLQNKIAKAAAAIGGIAVAKPEKPKKEVLVAPAIARYTPEVLIPCEYIDRKGKQCGRRTMNKICAMHMKSKKVTGARPATDSNNGDKSSGHAKGPLAEKVEISPKQKPSAESGPVDESLEDGHDNNKSE